MSDASKEAAAAAAAAADTADTPKKRKREILPDELEIDVSLPEPASKKAARKAKKAKLNPTPTADADSTAKTDGAVKEDKDTGKRSEYGVWIGNLPWSATKDLLRNFLCENSDIKSEQITRVHLPPPTKPANPNWTNKPLNKGFAYVDFSTELAMYSCIALTETKMDGRALLIKNAKSFEGRPDKPKIEQEAGGHGAKGAAKSAHPPNKRVFVGNLSFDVTKEDLEYHFGQAGEVEHIHMATFEDSGKCKGYAWVTFGDVEAATSAVNGYVFKDASAFKSKKGKDHSDSDNDVDTKKAGKKRKWLLNKIAGREVRCEFAEDATTRYNKRYGKEKPADAVDGVNPDRWKNFGSNKGGDKRFAKQDKGARPDGGRDFKRKVDPRTIRSGAAHSNAPRASQAIVESQGKKTTFE
ncbi:rna binding rnp24 [Pyrenophora seminiperda CCB06]|uniref:Rna binding rnp24 n=1 Tax=Pyrenophora seminiperda CCB06 TaxID=1302712 RepID=A0A3M7LWC1_9PLEO|nr:rna binding rnp24 [Pyrenophora seminiperda CCB06]